jgi:Family of unknown function (DUF5719)
MSDAPAPARRHLDRGPRTARSGSAALALVLVLLAGAAVALTAPAASTPVPTRSSSTGDPVTRTVLACPDPVSAPRVRTSVRLGLAGDTGATGATGSGGAGGGGSVERGAAEGQTSPVALDRGSVLAVPSTGGPTVRATGSEAAGLFGFRSDRRARSRLALSACEPPRAQWWFTGAGAGLDHSSTLLLTNVDPGPAVVDIEVLGPDGRVDVVDTRGIVVAPGSRRRIDLTGIAPQTDDLALGVHADRGRVVAAVDDSFATSATATPGQEWLPGTDRPSRAPELAGVPRGAGSRTLLVANPSDLEAVVDLRVSGSSGTFTPTGLGTISVAPGAIRTVDLTRSVPATEAVAVRLRSRVPVVASVRSVRKGDQSYATAVGPLGGPSAAPLVAGGDATVQLTADDRPSRVEVVAYGSRGRRIDAASVSIAANATRSWSPRRGAAYVLVTPSPGRSNGPVSGAVSYAGGGLAAVPLVALPLRERRPFVQPGLR